MMKQIEVEFTVTHRAVVDIVDADTIELVGRTLAIYGSNNYLDNNKYNQTVAPLVTCKYICEDSYEC